MVYLFCCILERAKTHSDSQSHFVDASCSNPCGRFTVWWFASLWPTALSHRRLGSMGPLELHKSKLRRMRIFYLWMSANGCGAGDIQRKIFPENGRITFCLFGKAATTGRAINGRDERRALCAAVYRLARSCSAAIKTGKHPRVLARPLRFWP